MIKATDIETLQKNKATIYGVTEDNEMLEIYTPYLHHPKIYGTNQTIYDKWNVAYETKEGDTTCVNVFTIENDYSNVFMSKKEAQLFLQFGNITRAEKFPYMSWEDFSRTSIGFDFKDKKGNKFRCHCVSNQPKIVLYEKSGNTDFEDMEWEDTEDNYSKVLEKCVELFLGEKYEP